MFKKIMISTFALSLGFISPILAADNVTTQPVIINDIASTGTLSALNSVAKINTIGHTMVNFTIPAGFVGTITPQVTLDGTNYINTTAILQNTTTSNTTITSSGTYISQVGGMLGFQLLVTAYTSGSAAVILRAGIGNNNIICTNGCYGLPVSPKVKLAIGLGFATGIVNTTNQYPVEIIPTYTNAIITGFRAAGSTTDNGTTVFTVYKNGTSIGTLAFASGASSASVTLGSSVAISVNDILTLSCTTAGTISNVGVIAEGQVDTF